MSIVAPPTTLPALPLGGRRYCYQAVMRYAALVFLLLLAASTRAARLEPAPIEATASDTAVPGNTGQRQGPCGITSTHLTPANSFFKLSVVRGCIESVSVNEIAAAQTKQALTDVLSMYSFLVICK